MMCIFTFAGIALVTLDPETAAPQVSAALVEARLS